MARFYGTVQGGRGRATRLGHATTGLYVTAQSMSGDIVIQLSDDHGEDYCYIAVREHSGGGDSKILYSGPFSALMTQSGRKTLVEAFTRDFLTGELEGQEAH